MGIVEAIEAIEARILAACVRSGRERAGVRLMAVTKFHQRPVVEEAWTAGLRLFGESRVQEASAKFSGFTEAFPGTELHMIGALQRNKVKAATVLFDCIESVDRDELIDALGALSGVLRAGREPLSILLELNAGEASKGGYAGEDGLFRGVERALAFPGLKIRGLMTMAPLTGDQTAIRRAFRNLRMLKEKLETRFPKEDWSTLSMGMSGDFETAIEEGATLVRIGTALFGERITS